MVDQANQVRAYEEALAKEQHENSFRSERKWALLRMRQVEKDTRAEREAAHKKRLREARTLARQQEDEVFSREKDVASHNERKERSIIEDVERKQRRRLAFAMWSSITTIQFEKQFYLVVKMEEEERLEALESYINDCEGRVRAFIVRITTSERTSLMQQEKSERIVTLRYVTAFSAWRADQDQQVNNLLNTERKLRYRVCDAEDIAFGEIDSIKQGILSDIAREVRRKHEARLAAIREMETFHHHQRRGIDDDESAGRNVFRGEDQTIRNQLRMAMLDDRKAAIEATNQRKQRELEKWKHECWLGQQPLIRLEAEARHHLGLDETTAYRLLQLLRQQLWDEILTPMVLLTTEDSVGPTGIGKRYLKSLENAMEESSGSSIGHGTASLPATPTATKKSSRHSTTGQLYKLRSTTAAGVARMSIHLVAPYSSPAVMLCPGVALRRKSDNRHYTTQPFTGVAIVVRLRGGGSPGDDVQLLSTNVHSIREKSASAILSLQGPSPVPAAAGGGKGAKGATAGGGANFDTPVTDPKVIAQQLMYPTLRTVDGVVYEEDNSVLGTIESSSAVPSLENCASYTDWAHARTALEEEQRGADGMVLFSMALPPLERENIKNVEKLLQSLVLIPGAVETVHYMPRRVDIEIHFQAPPKRRQSAVSLATKTVSSAFAPSGLTGNRSIALSATQTLGGSSGGGSPTLGGLCTYKLVITVRIAPSAPLLALASSQQVLFQAACRGVLYHDQRGLAAAGGAPSSTAAKGKTDGKGKEPPKVLTQLFPNLRGGSSLLSTWWDSILSESGASKLLALDSDFQGSVVRVRFLDGNAPEDTLQLIVNDEFSLKREEVKYTPPQALASAMDPLVCARLVFGKIVPVFPTSTKDIWFALPEAPSYWQPSSVMPQYIPPLVLHGLLSRIHFSTTSASTQRRSIEVTVAMHKKFGAFSSCLRVDVVNSGSAASAVALWSGVDDGTHLHQKFVDSHQPSPEHLRQFLEPDVVFPFRNFKVELGGKLGQCASETTLIGAGALRCSVSGDSTYLWDRVEVESRCRLNPFGMLVVVATPSAGVHKLMWSMHSTDESGLVHVGHMRHITSLEGRLRPSVVIDFNENCRFGAILAVVRSLSYSTTLPPSADGISKVILLELALGGAGKVGGDNGSPQKGVASKAGQRGEGPPSGPASGGPGTFVSNAAALLSAAVGPLRLAVQMVCTQSILLKRRTLAEKTMVVTLPRLEPTAECLSHLVTAGNAQVAYVPNEDGPLGSRVVPMLPASSILAPSLHAISHGAARDVPFDGAIMELTCFPQVDAAAGSAAARNASLTGAPEGGDAGSGTWVPGAVRWKLGIQAYSSQIVPEHSPDENDEDGGASHAPNEENDDGSPVAAPLVAKDTAKTSPTASNCLESSLLVTDLSRSCSVGSIPSNEIIYQWAPQEQNSKHPQLLGPLSKSAPLATIASILSASDSMRAVTVDQDHGSDSPREALCRIGPAVVSSAKITVAFGTKRREAVGPAFQVKGKQVCDVLRSLIVYPGIPGGEGTSTPSTPITKQSDASSPRSLGSPIAPSSPTAASTSPQQCVVEERVIIRIVMTDVYGHRQQSAIAVEVTPRNLPSTFEHVPRGPLVWRAGSEGYIKDTLVLLPEGTIEDEDTEATGESAYLRVESLAGFSQEDRIVFLYDKVPKHLQLLPAPLKIVEFVEPLNKEGELRRYHARYEAPGSSDEIDVGSGSLTCGVPNPAFSFVFSPNLPLAVCSQVLRQIGFRHDERFPRHLHQRQMLFRFNAMDGDGVVDTRLTLETHVAPPLMYTLPLYESARLRHGDSVKQVSLFPKVLVGIAAASELGRTLMVSLETRATDERLQLNIEEYVATGPSPLIFIEHRGGAKYVSFSCQYAETLFASVGAHRTTPFAAALGLENLPVTPTPGYEGVVFGKIVRETDKKLELELANEEMTRGHDVLPAICIPLILAKVLFRSNAFEPIMTSRVATAEWKFSDEIAASLTVRVLVESGEPVGSLSTSADSMDVFLQHPALVVPDASIGDLAMDTILGKEAEICASVVDATTSDQLMMGIGGMFDLMATSALGCSHSSLPVGEIRYASESRTIIVDDEEVAWVEVGRGLLGGSKLIVKFSQCPASVAQFILRRIAYVSEDPVSVGRARLLEVTLRVYATQPAPSMLHVQATVRPFPFTFSAGFSGRIVESRAMGQIVPVCKNGVGWSIITSGASANKSSTTRGLVVVVELVQCVPQEGSLFQSLFDSDPASLPQVLPKATDAVPWYDRVYVKSLPQHLSFGGAGRASHSIVWTGKGIEVCRYDASPDHQRIVLTFSATRQVPHQLVLDILGALVYEYRDEGGDPNASTDGAQLGDSAGKPGPGKGAKKGAVAAQPLPPALSDYSKGSRRFIAVQLRTILPSSSQSGTGDVAIGTDMIPIACVM